MTRPLFQMSLIPRDPLAKRTHNPCNQVLFELLEIRIRRDSLCLAEQLIQYMCQTYHNIRDHMISQYEADKCTELIPPIWEVRFLSQQRSQHFTRSNPQHSQSHFSINPKRPHTLTPRDIQPIPSSKRPKHPLSEPPHISSCRITFLPHHLKSFG